MDIFNKYSLGGRMVWWVERPVGGLSAFPSFNITYVVSRSPPSKSQDWTGSVYKQEFLLLLLCVRLSIVIAH